MKTKFKFTPNDFCKEFFGLNQSEYVGNGMTPLLENVLGKSNFNRYVFAQDPLNGKDTGIGDVKIHTGEIGQYEPEFYKVIGTIERI